MNSGRLPIGLEGGPNVMLFPICDHHKEVCGWTNMMVYGGGCYSLWTCQDPTFNEML